MADAQQRFCPLCDRSFIPGEAVLRCAGCQVMLHPACWVRNDGCTTEGDHRRIPEAIAYTRARIVLFPSGAETPLSPPQTRTPRVYVPPDLGEPLIGADLAELTRAQQPIQSDYRPSPPKRYAPPPDGPEAVKKTLPKIYGRRKFMAYWYVPAAVAVAIVVATTVIFVADWLFGGGDPAREAADAGVTVSPLVDTPTAGPSPTLAPSQTPTVTPTLAPGTPTAAVTGKFKAGDRVVVAGTGDCLRVRQGPGLDQPPVDCIADGTAVVIQTGPQQSDGLRWWRVQTPAGDGWAAEDYLSAP
ncbi:MAG: hypothetical protein ACKVVT_18880 [Dehalococcoidia bacterium]